MEDHVQYILDLIDDCLAEFDIANQERIPGHVPDYKNVLRLANAIELETTH